MTQIKAFEKKKNKKISKKESWYIFFIILLSLLLAFTILMYFNNPFIPPVQQSNAIKDIGEDVTITATECGGFTQVLSVKGSVLPNMVLSQNAYLKLDSTSENCVARAKFFIIDNKGLSVPISAVLSSDWQFENDGYYYHQSVLTPNLIVKFLNGIITPAGQNALISGNAYVLYITVETLPENADIQNLWYK